MITLDELLGNWTVFRSKMSEIEMLSLLRELVFNIETRCKFVVQAPDELLLNSKEAIKLKDYVSIREHDAHYAFSTPFWRARKRAGLTLEEVHKKTGIKVSELDKIEMGNNDKSRFLMMTAFANGCGCSLEFGVSKDLRHTRYVFTRNLKELGYFFRRLRKRSQWSFGKLAHETGLQVPFLKQIEHGHLNPKIETMRKIVKAYDKELITRVNLCNSMQ